MNKIMLSIFGMFAIVALMGVASACSCLAPGTPLEELNKSDAVFVGKVIDIKNNLADNVKEVTFSRSRIWKGPESVQMTIYTPGDSAGCGFEFEEDKEYMVYSTFNQEDERYFVYLCSRTALLSDAQSDIDALNDYGSPYLPPMNEPIEENTITKFFKWLRNLFN